MRLTWFLPLTLLACPDRPEERVGGGAEHLMELARDDTEHPPHHVEAYRIPAQEVGLPGADEAAGGLGEEVEHNPVDASHAAAELHPTDAAPHRDMSGLVELEDTDQGLWMRVEVDGLRPDGEHGFHIHEHGDCSRDAEGAGAHFDPLGAPHGKPGVPPHHLGDLGNLQADARGSVRVEMLVPWLTLGGEHPVLGRTLIIHLDPDDFVTQPHGDAGPRILCGIIGTLEAQ